MGKIEIDLRLWNALGGIELENNLVRSSKSRYKSVCQFCSGLHIHSLSGGVKTFSFSLKCLNREKHNGDVE